MSTSTPTTACAGGRQLDRGDRPAHLRKVHEEVKAAIAHPEHRVFVADKGTRQLLSTIANLLRLGTMGSTHFVLGDDQDCTGWLGRSTSRPATLVGGLRASCIHRD